VWVPLTADKAKIYIKLRFKHSVKVTPDTTLKGTTWNHINLTLSLIFSGKVCDYVALIYVKLCKK